MTVSTCHVSVYGIDCEVTLDKSSKTRWRAYGTCRGKYFEQISPSQVRAIAGWKYQAELANEFGDAYG